MENLYVSLRSQLVFGHSGLPVRCIGAAAPPPRPLPIFPSPSPYPISWELAFTHATPKRIAIDVSDSTTPRGYWYMTYTVTNETDKEQKFYPQIDLLTADGNVHASDEKSP